MHGSGKCKLPVVLYTRGIGKKWGRGVNSLGYIYNLAKSSDTYIFFKVFSVLIFC